MKKNILAITVVISFILLLGTITATEINNRSCYKNPFTIKSNTPSFLDVVRCTCDGKSCSNTQNGFPGAPAGSILVNCARICSCSGKIGFFYEAES
jgi:hypothetical protein